VALRLYRYFDRIFEDLGALWRAEPVLTPTLIPIQALAKCDYLRSFPHNVTFACHLHEDPARVEDFRTRHMTRDELDDQAFADMRSPEACLSPAVCYHTYHMHQGQTLPAAGAVYGICGRCFRYESTNLSDLRRLWDFTMREIVFLGARDPVLRERERGNGVVVRNRHYQLQRWQHFQQQRHLYGAKLRPGLQLHWGQSSTGFQQQRNLQEVRGGRQHGGEHSVQQRFDG
jgi:hypothetical protein